MAGAQSSHFPENRESLPRLSITSASVTSSFTRIVAGKPWSSRLWFCVQGFKERENVSTGRFWSQRIPSSSNACAPSPPLPTCPKSPDPSTLPGAKFCIFIYYLPLFFLISGHLAQARCSIKVCSPNGWQACNEYESAETAKITWGK